MGRRVGIALRGRVEAAESTPVPSVLPFPLPFSLYPPLSKIAGDGGKRENFMETRGGEKGRQRGMTKGSCQCQGGGDGVHQSGPPKRVDSVHQMMAVRSGQTVHHFYTHAMSSRPLHSRSRGIRMGRMVRRLPSLDPHRPREMLTRAVTAWGFLPFVLDKIGPLQLVEKEVEVFVI